MKTKLLRLIFAVAVLLFTTPAPSWSAGGCTYPSTLDTFSDRVAGDSLTVALLNQIMCGVEKIGAELGTLPKGSFGTVKLRLEDIDARFVALLGKSGGQTIIGGTASGNNLVLQSTSNATRGVVQVSDNFALDANTPAQITADQNNYALSDKGVQRWSSNAARSITGLAGGSNSKIVYAYNIGSFPIVVAHESSSSTAANRVTTVDALSITMWPGRGAVFVYDSTTSRWRGALLGSPELTAVMVADQTATQSSTTFQNVTSLVVPVTASRHYEFTACMALNAVNTTADAKFQFTVPAGTTMRWGTGVDIGAGGGATAQWNPSVPTGPQSALLTESGTFPVGSINGTTGVCFLGTIISSTTTGNVQLQFAQNTSNASDVKLLTGSWMRIRPTI